MSHKLLKNMDDETWRKFVGFCRMKGVRVAHELEVMIKEYVRKNLKKAFEE